MEFKVGDKFMGVKVKKVIPSGVFIEITEGIDAYMHISELSSRRVENIDDYVRIGDVFDVEIIRVDRETGKIKLKNLSKNSR